MESNNNLIAVKDLKVYFKTSQGTVKAVDGINFNISRGGSLGIVGESGCGKSVTSMAVMNLINNSLKKEDAGSILFTDRDGSRFDITHEETMSDNMRKIRGNEIAMIFQEPMRSLNPVYTIGAQIMEAILLHQKVDKAKAKEIAISMLEKVGIPSPELRVNEYPHQFSGGMRQRAMIAIALSCNPSLLIADEPTTALDVTIEAQILDIIQKLRKELNMALIMITHDIGVIAETVENVAVMYMGKIVETSTTEEILNSPAHPYTKALLKSIPIIGSTKRLTSIEGTVPNPYLTIKGCAFAARCDNAMEVCKEEKPQELQLNDNHMVSCWLYSDKKIEDDKSEVQ